MHHVTRFDPEQLATPPGYDDHHSGYGRQRHVGRDTHAVLTDFGTCELAPGASLHPHVHSYEELIYVLEGEPVLTVDGESRRLRPDDCAFVDVGATHAIHNPGGAPARWIDLVTPIAREPGEPADTFFVGGDVPTDGPQIDVRDPRDRRYARWAPAQMDLDVLKQPSPVDAPAVSASMSSALLAYSGIGVKMVVDERHGAHLGQLFMVHYQPGTVLHPHDHPIEEAFYMLEGEVVYLADGQEHLLTPGDVAFAPIGCIHAFENRTGVACRWLETRAPHPPRHHAYRFDREWDYLGERTAGQA